MIKCVYIESVWGDFRPRCTPIFEQVPETGHIRGLAWIATCHSNDGNGAAFIATSYGLFIKGWHSESCYVGDRSIISLGGTVIPTT